MDTQTEFNRIAIYLKIKKISQKALAENMGASVQTVSKWCNNKTQPTIKQLYEIANYLKVDARKLLVKNEYSN